MMLHRTVLLKAAIACLAAAWPLDILLFRRSGYLLFGVFLLLYLSLGAASVPRFIQLYLLAFGVAIALQATLLSLDWSTALLAMSAYVAVPLAAGSISLDHRKVLEVLGVFKTIAVIYFLGLLLQFAGITNEILVYQLTETYGAVHQRFTSFSGNPLLLGMFSFFAITVCLVEYQHTQSTSRRLWLLAILLMATTCLYFSYARRYYVLALLMGAYFILNRGKPRTYFAYAILVVLVSTLLVMVLDSATVLERLQSSLDFIEDPGNVSRVLMWLSAMNIIAEHPLLGLGIGSEGSVGKSNEELLARLEEGTVAEMYYLKVGVEFGIFVAAFFLYWMSHLVAKSFSTSLARMHLFRTVPLLGAVESVMGGALGSPFFAFPFWLVVTQMLRQEHERNVKASGTWHSQSDTPPEPPISARNGV